VPRLPAIDWTLTNALVTLALLAIPAWILWRRYRLVRTQAGVRKPISVGRARPIRELNLGPREGANVDLVVAKETFGWPEKLDRPNRVHWLWLRGETRSRRKVRRLLPVRLRPLRKVVANPEGTLTVTDTLINTFGQ
jgi:hypothetical protein